MKFVIQGLKYDTDKMKKIANVKKWYETNSPLVKAIYGNRKVGTTYDCELWRSEKGNWLLTHTEDYNKKVGHAITEEEWVKRIEEFLENEMLLHINPKSTILYAGNGIDFCGYIHYADHKKVRKSSIRKLKQDVKAYELGELPPEEFNRKYESRKGHLGHADTYHIAKAVEYELLFYEWERLEATA